MKIFRRFKQQINLDKGGVSQAQVGHLYGLVALGLDMVDCLQNNEDRNCSCSPERLEEIAGEIFLALTGNDLFGVSEVKRPEVSKIQAYAITSVCDGQPIFFSGMLHKKRGSQELWDPNPYQAEEFRSFEDAEFTMHNLRGYGQDKAMRVCKHPVGKQKEME